MIPKTRSFRDPWNPIGVLILLAAFAVAAGCSTAESPGGSSTNMNHVLPSGSSVDGWLVTPSGGTHASTATQDYLANNGSSGCTQCHGSDLSGGISNVSCFGNTAGCHHGPIPNWSTPAVHGATAKKAPGSSGFASCQICHGKSFSGGGANESCFTCHGVSAPHARKPWRGAPFTHATTDPANAPVCYQCHAYKGTANPNNPHVPPTPAPAGTAPGCFNGTMCHNQAVAHPAGWAATAPAAQPHGDAAKKDNTVSGQGFAYCKTCHGNNFEGTAIGPTCLSNALCHGAGVASPHAPKPWRGSPYTHTTTAEAGNAPVCYQCHAYTGTANPNNPHVPPTPAAAGTAPGCFNGTMCHNQAGHPAGWAVSSPAPQPHGVTAKKDNTVSGQGFAYCQTCHGANFAGGSANVSCFLCHGPPHAPAPWRGAPYTHTDTDPSNAPVCALCHRTSQGTPGCFNSTLCHGTPTGVAHAVPFNTAAHFSVDNTTFTASCASCHAVTGTSPVSGAPLCTTCHAAGSPLTATNCTSCHANPPSGATTAYPNVAGAHSKHLALASLGNTITCDTCHSGLGTNTLNHYNRAKSRVPPGDVAFLTTYNAKTGASSFDNSASLSCSNVSCHGGVARSGGNPGTPLNWQTGAIDVNTQCTNCHASGTTQFNSNNSGMHNVHSGYTCTECHDMNVATNNKAGVSNHFKFLSTSEMEGPAKDTFRNTTGSVVYTAGATPGTGTCTGTCHGEPHSSFSW